MWVGEGCPSPLPGSWLSLDSAVGVTVSGWLVRLGWSAGPSGLGGSGLVVSVLHKGGEPAHGHPGWLPLNY